MYFRLTGITILFFLNCSSIDENNAINVSQEIDTTHIKLTIERGAFHYDKFTLIDTVITFYPEDINHENKDNKYYQISEKRISKKNRDQFIKQLIKKGIFDLKDSYSTSGSCTSSLKVIVQYNDKTKTIQCDDFKRNCPKLLQFVEKEIISLHHQDLKRIYLPG